MSVVRLLWVLPFAASLVACRESAKTQASTNPRPSAVLADASAARKALAITEVAQVAPPSPSGRWNESRFVLHPMGDGEAYVSFRLNLGHLTPRGLQFAPELSRGLPLQTDPCVAPEIGELRRERSGRLVITLKDAGSPHFGAGCRDRDPAGIAYARTGPDGGWVPTTLPGWAPSLTRHVFHEVLLANKTVRLMGPRVTASDDGWNPPESEEHLSVCFGDRHPTLEGWDVPEGLRPLPRDLCVEAVAFGTSGADLLMFGRTRDGAMWLERRTPAAPSVRTRVDVPEAYWLRPWYEPTRLGDVDEGDLLVGATCRKPKDGADAERRTFAFHYVFRDGQLTVTPKEARAAPPDAKETVSLGHGFSLRRASTEPPPVVVYDPTEKEPPVLLFEGIPVLTPVHQASVLGASLALAEWSGRLFLLQRPSTTETTAPPVARFEETAIPEDRYLSLPLHEGPCGGAFFEFARIAADDHAEEASEAVLGRLTELVREHPELATRLSRFVEFRAGGEFFIGAESRETLLPPHYPGGRRSVLHQRLERWSRSMGLELQARCLFQYPAGVGKTFRFDQTGKLVWLDRKAAVRDERL